MELALTVIVLFPDTGNVPLLGERVSADVVLGLRTKSVNTRIVVKIYFFMAENLRIIYIE